jgi:hypothetical protein
VNAAARTARATLRTRTRTQRTAARAARRIATGTPQPVSTHLVAAGLDPVIARRFAGAVSRAAGTAQATATARIKLRGRTRKTVAVKLFTTARITPVLAAYRPKSPAYAAHFARLDLAA